MRLTKLGHACVRLEKDGRTLVLDPGAFTEPEALDGADAVLITHEHFDHFEEGRLRAAAEANPGLRIWTNGAVADQLTGLGEGRVRRVGHGDTFTAEGFEVEVHGEWHAQIHPEIPLVGNVGFLVDGQVFHPGDALTVPEREVDTLLLPVHAPHRRGRSRGCPAPATRSGTPRALVHPLKGSGTADGPAALPVLSPASERTTGSRLYRNKKTTLRCSTTSSTSRAASNRR